MVTALGLVEVLLTLVTGTLMALVLLRMRHGADAAELDDTARGILIGVPFVGLYFLIRAVQPILPDMGSTPYIVRNLLGLVGWAMVLNGSLRLVERKGASTAALVVAGTTAAAALPVFTFNTVIGVAILLSTTMMGAMAGTAALLAWRLSDGEPAAPLEASLAFGAAGLIVLSTWLDGLLLTGAAFSVSSLLTNVTLLLTALLIRPGVRTFDALEVWRAGQRGEEEDGEAAAEPEPPAAEETSAAG